MTDVTIFWRASPWFPRSPWFPLAGFRWVWAQNQGPMERNQANTRRRGRPPWYPAVLPWRCLAPGPQAVSWETRPAGDEMGWFWAKPS